MLLAEWGEEEVALRRYCKTMFNLLYIEERGLVQTRESSKLVRCYRREISILRCCQPLLRQIQCMINIMMH